MVRPKPIAVIRRIAKTSPRCRGEPLDLPYREARKMRGFPLVDLASESGLEHVQATAFS
jgi:hypothetical protein